MDRSSGFEFSIHEVRTFDIPTPRNGRRYLESAPRSSGAFFFLHDIRYAKNANPSGSPGINRFQIVDDQRDLRIALIDIDVFASSSQIASNNREDSAIKSKADGRGIGQAHLQL